MGYVLKRIDEMEAIFHGRCKLAAEELGVQSFGLQAIDLPAGADDYPEHDHAEDGQEEVYLALAGSAEFELDGRRIALTPGDLLRVEPGTRRKARPGPEGVRLLVVGGVPGQVYRRPAPFRRKAGPPPAG